MWSDDSLANRRLYPGHPFPTKNKQWANKFRTTDASMMLCVKRVQRKHIQTPQNNRKKLDPSQVEVYSLRAAVVLAIAADFVSRVPVQAAMVEKEWTNAWADGSDQVDMEVQGMILEQPDNFDPAKHVETLKKLMDQHILEAPVSAVDPRDQAMLNVDEFQLFIKQCDYDINVYETWQRKCSTVRGARFFREQEPRAYVNDVLLLCLRCSVSLVAVAWFGLRCWH